ncbi:hypothetical protein ACFQVC_32120 [Streptomyces monticola]|uniref:Uncharacterized protein n=1 Tax=Streptomyces monticola TaxID=2666263 RepID=A0ABW2JT67_9ACTN
MCTCGYRSERRSTAPRRIRPAQNFRLGFQPALRPHPDPRLPGLLAQVSWGAHARPTPGEELMHHAMRQRRTHRGPFQPTPLPATLIDDLRRHARAEGAELFPLTGQPELTQLAAVAHEAETYQHSSAAHRVELARWTGSSPEDRLDGVPAEASPCHPDSTLLAERDFAAWARGRTSGRAVDLAFAHGPCGRTQHPARHCAGLAPGGAGTTARPVVRAGHQVAAGFHTQALKIPQFRTRVRGMIPSGQLPQMILRLGHTNWTTHTPRRPAKAVLTFLDTAAA